MNNKGFTLIEVLATIVIISLAAVLIARSTGKTLSITKEETYKLMKSNIIKASENYLKECESNKTKCKTSWINNKTSFKAYILKDSGYYNNFKSPIDNKDLSNCLIITASKDNGTIIANIKDECYQ